MAKNNLTVKIKIISGIVGLLAIFATLVAGFCDIGDNTKAIDKHITVDKTRDDVALEETDKLENAVIAIEKDIEHIKEGMTDQKRVSKERYDEQKTTLKEIVSEIKAIRRNP